MPIWTPDDLANPYASAWKVRLAERLGSEDDTITGEPMAHNPRHPARPIVQFFPSDYRPMLDAMGGIHHQVACCMRAKLGVLLGNGDHRTTWGIIDKPPEKNRFRVAYGFWVERGLTVVHPGLERRWGSLQMDGGWDWHRFRSNCVEKGLFAQTLEAFFKARVRDQRCVVVVDGQDPPAPDRPNYFFRDESRALVQARLIADAGRLRAAGTEPAEVDDIVDLIRHRDGIVDRWTTVVALEVREMSAADFKRDAPILKKIHATFDFFWPLIRACV